MERRPPHTLKANRDATDHLACVPSNCLLSAYSYPSTAFPKSHSPYPAKLPDSFSEDPLLTCRRTSHLYLLTHSVFPNQNRCWERTRTSGAFPLSLQPWSTPHGQEYLLSGKAASPFQGLHTTQPRPSPLLGVAFPRVDTRHGVPSVLLKHCARNGVSRLLADRDRNSHTGVSKQNLGLPGAGQ